MADEPGATGADGRKEPTDTANPKTKIVLPKFRDRPDEWYDPEKIREELASSGQVSDYSDLESVHAQMNAARLSLYRTVKEQGATDRDLAVAEQKYRRVWNRWYLTSIGTDKIRTTMADVKSESLQNEFIQLQVRSRELTRRAQFLRDEIKALESLSNDYRQLIRSTT